MNFFISVSDVQINVKNYEQLRLKLVGVACGSRVGGVKLRRDDVMEINVGMRQLFLCLHHR